MSQLSFSQQQFNRIYDQSIDVCDLAIEAVSDQIRNDLRAGAGFVLMSLVGLPYGLQFRFRRDNNCRAVMITTRFGNVVFTEQKISPRIPTALLLAPDLVKELSKYEWFRNDKFRPIDPMRYFVMFEHSVEKQSPNIGQRLEDLYKSQECEQTPPTPQQDENLKEVIAMTFGIHKSMVGDRMVQAYRAKLNEVCADPLFKRKVE